MKHASKIIKLSVLGLVSTLTMGNQSCQQTTTPVRELKKVVDLGKIVAQPIVLPDGSKFDFQFVANQQMYGVLADSNGFAFRYLPPLGNGSSSGSTNGNGDGNFFNLPAKDQALMKLWKSQDQYKVIYSKEASCMVNLPQARISGSVNSFEMIGGGGLQIGFGPSGSTTSSGITSAGFNVQVAQLDLSMVATRPLTNSVMAAANVTKNQTKTNLNFGLNLGGFTLGPSFYYSTPLASVTKGALTKAVASLKDQLNKEDWYTRVLDNADTHLIIIGGVNLNLIAGDQLAIYDEDYYWDGEPCNSRYYGGGAKDPVAIIELDWVGDEISRGRVIKQYDDVVFGAKVKLYKFAGAPDPKPATSPTPAPVGSTPGSNSVVQK